MVMEMGFGYYHRSHSHFLVGREGGRDAMVLIRTFSLILLIVASKKVLMNY